MAQLFFLFLEYTLCAIFIFIQELKSMIEETLVRFFCLGVI